MAGMGTTRRIGGIGAGPGGICAGIELLPRRVPRRGRLGVRAAHRRHLAPQRLSRVQVRHAPHCTRSRSSARWTGHDPTRRSPRSMPISSTACRPTAWRANLRLGTGVSAARWGRRRRGVAGSSTTARPPRWTCSSVRWGCSTTCTGRRSRASGDFRARCSTPPAGTTTDRPRRRTGGRHRRQPAAVQFVPEIAKVVGQLHVFQRSPEWVAPKEDTPFTPEQLEALPHHPSTADEERTKIWTWSTWPRRSPTRRRRSCARERGLANLALVERPGSPAPSHARLPLRVQAAPDLQRLVPDVQPPERRAGDRHDREDHGRRGRDRRRT